MTWHIRLTQAREAAGIAKSRLAVSVGVSPQAVTQWESGETTALSADNLLAICDVLGIAPRWLMRGEGNGPRIAHAEGSTQPSAPTSLGERIKQARLAAGLSQEGLGSRLGKTQGAVSQWEQGTTTPEFEVAPPLARALGVTLDWLFGSDSTPLLDLRRNMLKRSGMQIVAQLSSALSAGLISEARLSLLGGLVTEFISTPA